MILPLQNFTTLVQSMAAGLQGSAAQLIDLSVGSVLRALLEACASVALWMQWLIVQVLAMTRASTSSGGDLDSWMADFSLVRLPGAASNGVVSFGRYTAGLAATVPVGAVVKTFDGSQAFVVSTDNSSPAWNGVGGYTIPVTSTAISVPVLAAVPGAAGNVLAGAVALLGTAIAGVDTVSNPLGFAGGLDAESDAALRGRFQLYINSRSLGTAGAVGSAIQSLQQGLRYSLQENVDQQGNRLPGHFCVVVDSGAGVATNVLIAVVAAAIDAVRPIGSTFSVSGPTILSVGVLMSVSATASFASASIAINVQQAITKWVSGLSMGATLAASKIEAIAHQTDANIVSVTSLQMNGAASDIVAPTGGVIQLSFVTVMVN